MPHITVKLYPGKTEEQKARLAAKIVQDAMEILGSSEKSLSVAFEEVAPEAWTEQVYKPDILGTRGKLYKKPGYEPS